MKKKFTCLILVTTLLFCSCSNAANDSIEEEIADNRKIIVLASVGGNSEVTKMVNDFNEQNTKYYIEEKQYLSTDDPIHTANDKLMLDITRGEQIDMLYLSIFTDMSAYIAKDMFVDLYNMIDNDNEISRDTYVDGILSAYEINGELYEMPAVFGFYTSIGRASVWKDKSLSIESILNKSKGNDNVLPFANLSGTDGFLTFIRGSINEYIDFENGVCNFTDGRFENALEFFYGYERLSSEQGIDSFSNGASLLYHVYISSLDDLDKYENIFGDDLIFLGMPSDNINYHTIDTSCSFGILSGSDNKQGAFEFMKFYTSCDYQINLMEQFDSFPVNKEAFSLLHKSEIKSCEEGVTRSCMLANNTKYEYRISEENMNAVIAEISSAYSSGGGYGEAIGTIIIEEAATFFDGSKTANEVCELIQNRMNTYLNEQY